MTVDRPTVITDVDHDMEIMQNETFGPVVAIQRVADEAEAVRATIRGEVGTQQPRHVEQRHVDRDRMALVGDHVDDA